EGIVVGLEYRPVDRGRLLAEDRLGAVHVHRRRAVVVDRGVHVVVHGGVHVVLGVGGDLLLALGVIEADLVVAAVARGRAALDAADHLGAGQGEGGHLLGVVDTADDDRPVRVSFEEIDDHLLADARDVHGAPLPAGPGGGHADPAGAVLVPLALAV